MDEEDTYNRLKGLTEVQADHMFQQVWIELNEEMGHPTGGLPMAVIKERLDPLLKPYGWSYDKLFRLKFTGDFS